MLILTLAVTPIRILLKSQHWFQPWSMWLFKRRRDLGLAAREFRAAVDAGPVDPVPAQCDLAEVLLASGDRAEAKRAVLAALEAAPTYERAQQLLLRIVEGK
jgi:predicted Zn-dependent protease